MRGHMAIPLARAWNSWTARPAEMTFLPLGLHITPMLYSTRLRKTSLIEPRSDEVQLGAHTIHNECIALKTRFAGAELDFETRSDTPFAIRGSWSAGALSEWGTRFWLSLAIHGDHGEVIRFDRDSGAVLVSIDRRFLAVVTQDPAIQVTGHASVEALQADFEANGYFYTASRADAAPVMALRFNMEMMRTGGYGAAIADSEALAIAGARKALAADRAALAPLHAGRDAGALESVRDVVGWNTIWDNVNHRPYTAVTRIWNLGKFAVWYNDQTFAALAAGMFDMQVARENMEVALAGATPEGNVACIVTSNDAWVDRSQPPHGALVAWLLYLRSGERSLIAECYEALARNQLWWRTHRDPDGVGLISCGTSDVGDGLYKGTVFGARNETGMDNSTTHDEAGYEAATRTLSTFDLGLNCALAADAEMLSRMADMLGKAEEAQKFAALAFDSRHKIQMLLWDEDRKIFANRQRKGGFVRALSPTSFYPLLCGAATAEQAEHLLGHLADPARFAGDYVLPNATRDDPSFGENVYWRGRVWPNVNFLVWLGLKRYGFFTEASRLADQSFALFEKNWREKRIAAENYNSVTGEAMDQGDTDPFYIWAALLPMMAVEEHIGFDPWNGFSLNNRGEDVTIGPLLTPMGSVTFAVADGRALLSSPLGRIGFDFRGRITGCVWEKTLFCGSIHRTESGGHLFLYSREPDEIVCARINGVDAPAVKSALGVEIALPAEHAEPCDIAVWLRPKPILAFQCGLA